MDRALEISEPPSGPEGGSGCGLSAAERLSLSVGGTLRGKRSFEDADVTYSNTYLRVCKAVDQRDRGAFLPKRLGCVSRLYSNMDSYKQQDCGIPPQ